MSTQSYVAKYFTLFFKYLLEKLNAHSQFYENMYVKKYVYKKNCIYAFNIFSFIFIQR